MRPANWLDTEFLHSFYILVSRPTTTKYDKTETLARVLLISGWVAGCGDA